MSKKKRTTWATRTVVKAHPPRRPIANALRLISAGLGVIVLLFGLWQGIDFIWPKLTVESQAALDPSNPFSAPFILRNDGALSIHKVEHLCQINRMILLNGNGAPSEYRGVVVSNTSRSMEHLPARTREHFACNFKGAIPPGLTVKSADIELVVLFRPFSSYFWIWDESFRFETRADSAGHLTWMPRGSSILSE